MGQTTCDRWPGFVPNCRRAIPAAAAVLLAIGLGALGGPALAQDPTAPALLPAPVVPKPPSIDRAAVDAAVGALDGVVTTVMETTGVPGVAVAVVYDDAVIYRKGFGVREAGRPEPIDTDTVFLLASVSKPIASTVVAGLAGRKLFALDDPVSRYDETFRLADPYVSEHATFADLLSHRSGLFTGAGDFLEDLGFDRETILGRLHMQPLDDFRTAYHYSNFGYTAGGQAAAKAAGKPWEDVAEEILFEPLGMSRTSYRHADYLAHDNRARIHVRTGPDGTRWAAQHDRIPDAEAPAGGASSSIADIAKFMRLQLANGKFDGEEIIDAAALALAHAPQSITSRPDDPAARSGFYGLGWNVSYDDEGRTVLGHSGAFNLGTATNVTLLPGEGLGIAVLTNGEPIGVPEAIAMTFIDIAEHGHQTVDWLPFLGRVFDHIRASDVADARAADPTGDPGPGRPLEAYEGTYDNAYFGPLTVTRDGDTLTMSMGPQDAPVSFPLTRDEGDRFTFETIGEWATGPSVALFRGDADGKAKRVTLGAYDTRGLGTFERP